MDNYHLTPDGDKWKLKKEGGKKATKTFTTKKEAVSEGTKFMRGRREAGSLKIHKQNGEIQEERTYPGSADPASSPG